MQKKECTHEIRLCKIEEKEKLQNFISKYWRENHILSTCDALLDFQHLNKEKQIYNFCVAFNPKTQEFDAVLGFIATKLYDESLEDAIWLAIWKSKEEYPSLGLQLILYLQNQNFSSIGAIGVSQSGIKFYKALRYTTGVAQHFYIKNDALRDFKLLESRNAFKEEKPDKTSIVIKKISKQDLLNSDLKASFYPRKSVKYLINRYLNVDFYEYLPYGIFVEEKLIACFIIRVIEQEGARVLRIIDFLGEFPKNARNSSYQNLQEILKFYDAEYLDCLCYMQDYSGILGLGFQLKCEDELIPNYFEPFEKRNIEILYAYKSRQLPYVFFKGDADQDRPNFIRSKA